MAKEKTFHIRDEDTQIPSDKITVRCYSKGGKAVDPSDKRGYAKKVFNETKGVKNYYVKVGRGTIYDPSGIYATKANPVEFSMKKVSEKTFNSYVKYLTTRKTRFLTSAERYMFDA